MDVVLRALKLVWIDFLYYCGLKLMYVFAMWNYSTTTWRAQFENFWISIVLRLHNDQHWRSTAKCAIGICFDIQNWFIIAWPELRCLERERSVGKGSRSSSRIGRKRKNTLWKRKKPCAENLVHGESSEFPEPIESSNDTAPEESSIESPEVPSDLEDMVLEIAAELDSPVVIPSIPVIIIMGPIMHNHGWA